MRDVILTLEKKINICKMSGDTDYTDGYITALTEAIEEINKAVIQFLCVGQTYYVIMYEDGNIAMPYVEKMKLFLYSESPRNYYCFSKNLDAAAWNTRYRDADCIIRAPKELVKRVYFTKEQALRSIAITNKI